MTEPCILCSNWAGPGRAERAAPTPCCPGSGENMRVEREAATDIIMATPTLGARGFITRAAAVRKIAQS